MRGGFPQTYSLHPTPACWGRWVPRKSRDSVQPELRDRCIYKGSDPLVSH
ncbi:MAG: hypothetical protein F6J93_33495 [Oscillatoria sp. SIO1A7]|nr:hypothetical protein [Oscillatoria sp. SIO1A7]